MRAIAGGRRTRARMARACALVLVVVLLALLELALRRRGGEGKPRPSPRNLRQFNDVGNIVNAGIGGFPNAIYRDWWAPLWPTSCFAVGNYGLWSLAQCVMFTGTF